jgi:RNA polymerase sigma-70 factor, ECF subfamily
VAHDDDERWRQAFEAEQGRMWRALWVHGGDPDLAADAVAEAFAQGIRRGAEVRDPAAWTWRAAFRIADGLLAERRRTAADTDAGGDVPDPAGLPDEVVGLIDVLGRLPEADRRVVVLSLVGGLGAAEVGSIVGASPGAVRVRLHRARRRLRDALTDRSPTPEEVP